MQTLTSIEIWTQVFIQFTPVWIGLALIMGLSFFARDYLSLYGRLYYSGAGFIGLGIVLFWVLTAIFADQISTFGALEQYWQLKRKPPGMVEPKNGIAFLFGGDNLGRDIFSRMVQGSRFVLAIAPGATLIAFMVGISLGLPAGYFGGKIDSVLSFIANLVLAFPVILLFYLLVTPGVLTDLVGFALLLPMFRRIVKRWLRSRLQARIVISSPQGRWTEAPDQPRGKDRIIDSRVIDVPPEESDKQG